MTNGASVGTNGITLLPCPFCGGEAEMCHVTQLWEPRDSFWARCKNTRCGIIGTCHVTEHKAIAAWNTRADESGPCCPKCGKRLHDSDVDGYKYVCRECDENFYAIEAWNTRTPEQAIAATFGSNAKASRNYIGVSEEGSICPIPRASVVFEGQKLTFDAEDSEKFAKLIEGHLRKLAGLEVKE